MLDGTEQRISIIGCSGSGKTTLAVSLGRVLGLPVVHLDRHFWLPGWKRPDDEQWRERVAMLIAEPRWIMDGNFSGTMATRIAASDAVIFMDLPRWVCLARILWRWLTNLGGTRPDMAPGCREQINIGFLAWVWSYNARRRPRVLQRLADAPPAVKVVTLRSPSDIRDLLARVDGPFANVGGETR